MKIENVINAFAKKYFPAYLPIVALVVGFSSGLLTGVQPYVSLAFNESSGFIAKAVDIYGANTPVEMRDNLGKKINEKTSQFNIYVIHKDEAECYSALVEMGGGGTKCLTAQ